MDNMIPVGDPQDTEVYTFADALKHLHHGGMVRRKCWEEDSFIFQQIPATIQISVVPRMTSLPEPVKQVFIDRHAEGDADDPIFSNIRYKNQIALVSADNEISAYSITVADANAEDWEPYE